MLIESCLDKKKTNIFYAYLSKMNFLKDTADNGGGSGSYFKL